jgi:hypothetical protein
MSITVQVFQLWASSFTWHLTPHGARKLLFSLRMAFGCVNKHYKALINLHVLAQSGSVPTGPIDYYYLLAGYHPHKVI